MAHTRSGHLSSLPLVGAGFKSTTGRTTATTLLTLFTASLIGLIIYTMAKMLSARLFPGDSRRHRHRYHHNNNRTGKKCFGSTDDLYQRPDEATRCTDLRQQRRELLKLSREERVRRLIQHHGGRNVSQAIRFLAAELREQKNSILKSLLMEQDRSNEAAAPAGDYNDPSACVCSCHVVEAGIGDEPLSKRKKQRQRDTRPSAQADLEPSTVPSGPDRPVSTHNHWSRDDDDDDDDTDHQWAEVRGC